MAKSRAEYQKEYYAKNVGKKKEYAAEYYRKRKKDGAIEYKLKLVILAEYAKRKAKRQYKANLEKLIYSINHK